MDIHIGWFHICVGIKPLNCKRYITRYMLLSLLLLIVNPLWAESYATEKVPLPLEKDGVVKLVATLQNSPAFKDVEWRLSRLDLPGRPVMTIKRHAASVNLRPGTYRVVALLGSIVRSRSFQLKSSETTEVIVPMDK